MRMSLRFKMQFLVVLILACTIFSYILIASRFLEKDRLASLAEATTNQGLLMENRVGKKFVSLRFWIDSVMNDEPSARTKAFRENPHFLGLLIRERGVASWFGREERPRVSLPTASLEGNTFLSFPEVRLFVLGARSKEGIENFSFWSFDLLDEEFTQTNSVFAIIPRTGNAFVGAGLDLAPELLSELRARVAAHRSETLEKDIRGDSHFLSLSSLEGYPALVVWGYPKSLALTAVRELRWMSLSFAVFALGLTAFLSLWSAGFLTKKLRHLTEQTARIASGDLEAPCAIKSQDEVGDLSRSIVSMASSLKTLIRDVAEKSRMETELNTAKVVQETLVANEPYRGSEYEIHGHLENASECGGDFWFHWQLDRFLFFIIADATGHGASAALITSAVRSTIASMKLLNEKNLERVVEHLHVAVRETSKSRIMMTAFIGRLDTDTGEVQYFDCSHERPFIFGKDRPPGDTLKGAKSPRLGDAVAQRDSFKSSSITLREGEALFLYTDGLIDGEDVDGVPFSARRLNTLLTNEFRHPAPAAGILSKVFLRKRTGRPQEDDMTAMILLRKNAS